MVPHASDSDNPDSHSLSSRHARNKLFGGENCYTCHADYGMFGTITTKLGGMKHVWLYYTQYRNTSLAEAKKTIKLYEPYPNDSCMQCHSTKVEVWLSVPDHKAALDEVRSGAISCASGGCHGFAHPYTKTDEQLSMAVQTVHLDCRSCTLSSATTLRRSSTEAHHDPIQSSARAQSGVHVGTRSARLDVLVALRSATHSRRARNVSRTTLSTLSLLAFVVVVVIDIRAGRAIAAQEK